MIEDLSKTLQVLLTVKHSALDPDRRDFFERLKREAPQLAGLFARLAMEFPLLSDAAIKFDRPVENYEADPSGTVNVFLFEIRENFALRSNEPIIERRQGSAVLLRPPRRVACTYLVTAWYGGAEKEKELKEQGLLSQALQVFLRFPVIPNELLWGRLKDQQPPLPMVALAADGIKNPVEFWTALGGKLRPAFAVTATISVPDTEPGEPMNLISQSAVRIGEKAPDTKAP